MRAHDQFHAGIVVDDIGTAMADLSALFGYEWCDEIGGPVSVSFATGEMVVDLRLAYSRSVPRVELVRAVPGTLWMPALDSGIHHLGYWSDDVGADAEALERRGCRREAAGVGPDGAPMWTFHRSASGPRIELLSRAMQPSMEQYFETGAMSL